MWSGNEVDAERAPLIVSSPTSSTNTAIGSILSQNPFHEKEIRKVRKNSDHVEPVPRPVLFRANTLLSSESISNAIDFKSNAAPNYSYGLNGSTSISSTDHGLNILTSTSIPLLHQLIHTIRPAVLQNLDLSLGRIIDSNLSYTSLLDLLPTTLTPAISAPPPSKQQLSSSTTVPPPSLTHQRLRWFLEHELSLSTYGITVGSRVAVLLPNGPELAVALIAVTAFACCAPVNTNQTAEEVMEEIKGLGCTSAIILNPLTATPSTALPSSTLQLLKSSDILVLGLTPTGDAQGVFKLTLISCPPSFKLPTNITHQTPNKKGDIVLVLHTSGTSGKKKVVPYPLESLVTGAACVSESWGLGPSDVDLNQMPMYHIGGIARNLFAPVLVGGCTVFCSGFDAEVFWDIVIEGADNEGSATWYYAAPTMHMMIIAEGKRRIEESEDKTTAAEIYGAIQKGSSRIRMVCNAAGGLLPSLALELRSMFPSSVVLPSYGMTECMPISTPKLDYNLDRPGTSGRSCGPELAIADDSGNILPPNEHGNIVVRGPPLMPGYFNNDKANLESFFSNGWFNTGDKGHLDEDGYIFLTGRSKEVINRGGEIISPFDVEEAVLQHPAIKDVIAFTSPDSILQEVVGIAIVIEGGFSRPDIKALHVFLNSMLHPAKWPQIIVFVDEIPKNGTSKVLRIDFAKRCKLPELTDATPLLQRLYEVLPGGNPPKGTPLSVPIPLRKVEITSEMLNSVAAALVSFEGMNVADAHCRIDEKAKSSGRATGVVCTVGIPSAYSSTFKAAKNLESEFHKSFSGNLNGPHSYALPCKYEFVVLEDGAKFLRNKKGAVKLEKLSEMTRVFGTTAAAGVNDSANASTSGSNGLTFIEITVVKIFAHVLGLDDSAAQELDVDSDFFSMGGDSLKAGMLNGLVRKHFRNEGVVLPTGSIFNSRTVGSLAKLIEGLMPSQSSNDGAKSAAPEKEEKAEAAGVSYNHLPFQGPSSTRLTALLIQLLPIAVFHPLLRTVQWFTFLFFIIYAKSFVDSHSLSEKSGLFQGDGYPVLVMQFIFGVSMARAFKYFVLPNIGILFKWFIMGSYKKGRYPLFGSDYLRWWLVRQVLNICGRGVYLSDNRLHIIYHRLLGASIGKNVKLNPSTGISEHDLVIIGDDCIIDHAVIRPFCMETGLMVLDSITIGNRVSIGMRSVCAPGSVVKDDSVIGPLSSTHEMHDFDNPSAAKKSAEANRQSFPQPSLYTQWLIGLPLITLVRTISAIPWLVGVAPLILVPWFVIPNEHGEKVTLESYLEWFALKERIHYYLIVRIVARVLSPIFHLGACILLKKFVLGKFKTGDWGATEWGRFRYWIIRQLLPGRDLGGAAHILGTHYQLISSVYRALGATIGERIYWPGSGIDVVEFDLLQIDDDVVFGSRSLMLGSTKSTSQKIHIKAGSMVADRCLIFPGVTLGKNAVLGSGCITELNGDYKAGSIYLGSSGGAPVLWDEGNAEAAEKQATVTPFAKAYYYGEAPYYVMPLGLHVLLNVTVTSVWAAFWVMPLLASVQLVVYVQQNYYNESYMWRETFVIFFLSFSLFNVTCAVIALFFCFCSKWLIMGRRKPGPANWNTSSYCQRWQVYLVLEKLRQRCMGGRGVLDFISGSAWLVWYFRLLGSNIGDNVCLYPNGGDPMMTEPDLVTIGNNACIDDASLIAHINSKGQFSLNPLKVGDDCVMRYGCRLLSGASMDKNSMVMEHTLVLSGETIDEDSVWQGWPARIVSTNKSKIL